MNVKQTFKTSLNSLSLNKVRSFLTMLGVIIGVFAVVSLVSLVEGVQNYIEDQFESLGSNLIFIVNGSIENSGRGNPQGFTNNNLEIKHIDLIRNYAGDYIESISPTIQMADTVQYKTQSYYSQIIGVNYEAEYIFNTHAQSGRFFSKNEERGGSKVVVLGNGLNNKLFGDSNSVGKQVKLNGKQYEVVGVLDKKSPDYDDSLIIPYTTLERYYDSVTVGSISAKVKDGVDFDEAVTQVKLSLMRDLGKDDFSVMSQEDILESIDSILNILTVALAAISGISLIVGGIGIMNIMLVSVTERTREIGLRKALGATGKDIKLQFMIEAICLSISGGIVGLVLGWVATLAARPFIRAEIPYWAALLALGFSIIVGIAFGTYPAVKASNKDPIEALRYE